MSHNREPIKHTCPDIDKTIGYIKRVIVRDNEIKRMSEQELIDTVEAMNSELYDCIGFLEQMRKSNDALRSWGIEEAKEVDSLNNYVEELEEKLKQPQVA